MVSRVMRPVMRAMMVVGIGEYGGAWSAPVVVVVALTISSNTDDVVAGKYGWPGSGEWKENGAEVVIDTSITDQRG